MDLHSFIGNFLEPLAYFVYLAAVMLFQKKRGETSLNLLRIYYSFAFLLMLATSLSVHYVDETNWLYSIHALVTVVALGLYFRRLFSTVQKKNITTVLIAATVIYLLVKNVVLGEYHLFDSIGFSLVSASVVLLVLMYFHQLLSNITDENILHNFNFWLSSGFLIYFLGNFIIFLTYHYFTAKIMATYTHEERYIMTNLWGLHNCLLFAGALSLLAGSLWIVYRRKSALS